MRTSTPADGCSISCPGSPARSPQIGVLYGPDIAGSAYIPVFCDFLIMVEEISGMAIASPGVVKEVISEDISM